MIKLVAFDWNGTLFSDTRAICEGVNEVLKLFNMKPTSVKNFQKHFDVPVKKTYLGLGIPEDELSKNYSKAAQTFHEYYEQRVSKVRTRANAKELLDFLDKNNISSVIFSNHIHEPIKKQLKRLNIERYFSQVLANSQLEASLHGRSKQEKLRSYIDDNNLLQQQVLIIGDTIEEIEIGKELGVITAAITHGNCSTTRLKAAKPDYLINNLREVIGIIRKSSD